MLTYQVWGWFVTYQYIPTQCTSLYISCQTGKNSQALSLQVLPVSHFLFTPSITFNTYTLCYLWFCHSWFFCCYYFTFVCVFPTFFPFCVFVFYICPLWFFFCYSCFFVVECFFKKSLLNLLQYCFCFMFWIFGLEACGILTPWPGIRLIPTALEGSLKHWTTRDVLDLCDP